MKLTSEETKNVNVGVCYAVSILCEIWKNSVVDQTHQEKENWKKN
jgi:hypothetical protein